ncbi:hypothetical protein AK812_SmicGene32895 [Symbiodinium microadriaticum]|uniref:Uncharacterized protein n=1 Tax=Symbiodinium microadriaticum TaxID=2951 RepID=A0A1Q9CSY7_SYMMI|nr:hypothetical protein AK812_SmicGene32895 [Symbiodinium microadriaticum]CAE7891183.1 unnamed protein product [Symbiodinium microadriaticum]
MLCLKAGLRWVMRCSGQAVPTNLMKSVARQIGNPDMTQLTQLTLSEADLPEEWRDAMTQARIGAREFERGHLMNAVRKKSGLNTAFEGVASSTKQSLAPPVVPANASRVKCGAQVEPSGGSRILQAKVESGQAPFIDMGALEDGQWKG